MCIGSCELSIRCWRTGVCDHDEICYRFSSSLFLEPPSLTETADETTYAFQQPNEDQSSNTTNEERTTTTNEPVVNVIATPTLIGDSDGSSGFVEQEIVVFPCIEDEGTHANSSAISQCGPSQTRLDHIEPDAFPVQIVLTPTFTTTRNPDDSRQSARFLYKLRFDPDLASEQRSEYLTEIIVQSSPRSDSISIRYPNDPYFFFPVKKSRSVVAYFEPRP